MSELKEVTVKFVFNADDLGEEWMNRDNLELLLYSGVSTRRDLFEIVEYDTRPTNVAADNLNAGLWTKISDEVIYV